jgi:hypothetical protein
MKVDGYKSFIKSLNNSLCYDFILHCSCDDKHKYNYSVNLNGTFTKNDIENSFTSYICFSITVDDKKAKITSINIKNISINNNIFDDSTVKKYLNCDVDMFDVCSAEIENDCESDIYSLINTMFSNSSVSILNNKFIVNLKFNNNIDSISVLSLKIKLSTITKKLPCNSLNNNSFENTTYCILIAIFTVFLILTKGTFNFSKSNMLFFKLKKSILNFQK